jgi:hypothetical protein
MPLPDDANNIELRTLEIATDHTIRNALALRLAESGTPGLPGVLIRLIRREDLRAHRGTLVHSLSYFDCTAHLDLLVDLVIQGNWEVAHEAFQIVEMIPEANGDQVEQAFTAINRAISTQNIEDWRRSLLDRLAHRFD